MDDKEIIALYWRRDQDAIVWTDRKYGGLCRKLAFDILANHEDTEECVSDTYLAAWNSIPPQRPSFLKAYLVKIVRNFSLMRVRQNHAGKHGGGEIDLVLEELEDTLSSHVSVEQTVEQKELAEAVSRFLHTLPEMERNIFLARYYFLSPVAAIAARGRCSQSKVKTSLYRTRKKLKQYLIEEELL